ncbi:MAG: helix-turn-helix transcriptional regulator [Chloroflexi bacterium]|nr:helix-turn-helix transcriptional regulator [Chloroflexota bacterium]
MTATARRDTPDSHISALRSANRPGLDAGFILAEPMTANTYPEGRWAVWTTGAPGCSRAAAGLAAQFDYMPAESTAEAIMEIRRRSGLTWQELAELFDVSRRSVHHWANGNPASAGRDRTIRRTLAAIRHLDRGSQQGTRSLLLAVDQATGVSALDLLQAGRFDKAMARPAHARAPEPHRSP